VQEVGWVICTSSQFPKLQRDFSYNISYRGIQIAVKKDLKVFAIDRYVMIETENTYWISTKLRTIQSGDIKKQLCLSLGATDYLDYREVDIVQAIKAKTGFGVHAVICTANGERAYEQSMQMLRPLGTLVCVGIPSTPFKLPATPFDMIVKG
jgi:propanol-preferring alcohol dehydrogenase